MIINKKWILYYQNAGVPDTGKRNSFPETASLIFLSRKRESNRNNILLFIFRPRIDTGLKQMQYYKLHSESTCRLNKWFFFVCIFLNRCIVGRHEGGVNRDLQRILKVQPFFTAEKETFRGIYFCVFKICGKGIGRAVGLKAL